MRTRAIILKKQNTNEYDQLVTCYTEEFGKLITIAKSVLKPSSIQAMHLDNFNLVDFELINGRAIPIITGAQSEKSFLNLKSSLALIAVGSFFVEVIDRIAFEHQKDEDLWGFLVSTLEELNSNPANLKSFFRDKKLEFLDILGYAPNLDDCVFCGKISHASTIAYNAQAKGIVCKDCFLNGREGIVIKSNEDILSGSVLGGIFESLAEKKINSLSLVNSVLK